MCKADNVITQTFAVAFNFFGYHSEFGYLDNNNTVRDCKALLTSKLYGSLWLYLYTKSQELILQKKPMSTFKVSFSE